MQRQSPQGLSALSLETARRNGRHPWPAVRHGRPFILYRCRAPWPLSGLMGAGKSAIGKRLALRLGLPFVDADDEIERAAGCSIAEFFEKYGEAEFRAGERRVIARLLDGPPHVLSTGGGAYMDAETRALMRAKAVTVWLRADLDVLFDRVQAARPPAAAAPGRSQGGSRAPDGPALSRSMPRPTSSSNSTAQPADRDDRAGDRGAARLSCSPAGNGAGMSARARTVRVEPRRPQLRHR